MIGDLYCCFMLEEKALNPGPIGYCAKVQGMVCVTDDLEAAVAGARHVYCSGDAESILIMLVTNAGDTHAVRFLGELPDALFRDPTKMAYVVQRAESLAGWELEEYGVTKLGFEEE